MSEIIRPGALMLDRRRARLDIMLPKMAIVKADGP